MKPLEDSIRENGIIQPLMVRKDDKADVYEIISGHRRYLAATRLKLTEVPVVVLDITKEEADIILVDSNLYREHILPSEKAFAYKMKMDAIKRQGNLLSANTNSTEEEMDPGLYSCLLCLLGFRKNNAVPVLCRTANRYSLSTQAWVKHHFNGCIEAV